MKKIKTVSIENLFGTLSYNISIREDAPTLLTAPNGAGKTHILTMLSSLFSSDFLSLSSIPFDELRVVAEDDSGISVERIISHDQPALNIHALRNGECVGKAVSVTQDSLMERDQSLPPWIQRVGPNRWRDIRNDADFPTSYIQRRYRLGTSPLAQMLAESKELQQFLDGRVTFVDTRRLDTMAVPRRTRPDMEYLVSEPERAEARIAVYMRDLERSIQTAQRESVSAAQESDSRLVEHALQAAHQSFVRDDLKRKYESLQEHYQALAVNNLAVGVAPIPFPEDDSPTIRRIMGVFLEDFESRLKPLLRVNTRIQTLRDILDTKLAVTGKRTVMLRRGGLGFLSIDDKRVPVEQLSSGEQHLVAIFTSLLFATEPGSLVLIDEPEISLHMAWQHDFVDDMSRIAQINDLQVIMATHSTAIVNGRSDLREALHLPKFIRKIPAHSTPAEADDLEDEEL